ncbi:MAG: hypothetical protein R3B70_03345 [Polyangiaceae bacterium]
MKLAKAGHSARSIEAILAARGHSVKKSTIAAIAKRARESMAGAGSSSAAGRGGRRGGGGEAGGRGARLTSERPAGGTGRPAAGAKGSEAGATEAGNVEGEEHGADLPAELAGLDAADLADRDLAGLVQLANLLDASLRSALAVRDARLASSLWSVRERVSLAIARLRPPVPPDPAKDPANVQARDALRARLERLVASGRESGAGLAQLRAHVAEAEAEAQRRGDAEAEAQRRGDAEADAQRRPASGGADA